MNNEILKAIGYSLGKNDAADLRRRACNMNGTEIIDEEFKIPAFNPSNDYSSWPCGSPVSDFGQIWQLMQPHNASHYSGRPENLRALWSLCHTKNPLRAKLWADPFGTSGAYQKGECYKTEDGHIYMSKSDGVIHDAIAAPEYWSLVE